MLEVKIIECGPAEWEWRVCHVSGQCIEVRWENTRAEAKRQGEGALFRLLAYGWETPSIGYGTRRGH
jgi:hypothetical protein